MDNILFITLSLPNSMATRDMFEEAQVPRGKVYPKMAWFKI